MIEVVEPTDKPSIGIEQIRNQLKKLSLSNSRQNSQRFVLIQPAEMLTTEAQNALLKTLEEPPERTVIVLGVNQASRLLETVRSRCTTTTISSPQEKIAPAAAKFLADTPYQRLIQCKILADAKNDLQVFNAGLQRLCLAEATSKPATELRRQIAALELCRQQLAANVSRRSALEVLSLEL